MINKRYLTGKNFIFAIFILALLLILPKISGILMLFFAAYVLACALNPYVTKLTSKMKRTLASSLVVFTSILVILAILVPIFFVAFKEIKTFAMTLPDKITELTNYILNTEFYGHRIPEFFDADSVFNNSQSFAQGFLSHSISITAGIVQVGVIVVALTMIVYYILVDKSYLKKKFLEFFPPDLKEKATKILSTISSKVGAYVRAQILSMAAVGVMMWIVLLILGVEYSTLLGLISGVLDIIPILGPSIALGVILLIAYPLGWVKLILVILGFLAVQQISNYVVRPFLFGKMMALHPLMIFLALFLAQQFLGFWGVILSPAIAATVCVLIDELYIIPINLKTKENDE